MKVLVANLGSTSFKYRLFDMSTEKQLARGGIDRIGLEDSNCSVEIGDYRDDRVTNILDHAAAVNVCLEQLSHPEHGCLKDASELKGIGFKAVFAGKLSGVRVVDDELLTRMEELADVAPAHNPPYARAMRQLRKAFPSIPLVAASRQRFGPMQSRSNGRTSTKPNAGDFMVQVTDLSAVASARFSATMT